MHVRIFESLQLEGSYVGDLLYYIQRSIIKQVRVIKIVILFVYLFLKNNL